jgi:hypothetical protein
VALAHAMALPRQALKAMVTNATNDGGATFPGIASVAICSVCIIAGARRGAAHCDPVLLTRSGGDIQPEDRNGP